MSFLFSASIGIVTMLGHCIFASIGEQRHRIGSLRRRCQWTAICIKLWMNICVAFLLLVRGGEITSFQQLAVPWRHSLSSSKTTAPLITIPKWLKVKISQTSYKNNLNTKKKLSANRILNLNISPSFPKCRQIPVCCAIFFRCKQCGENSNWMSKKQIAQSIELGHWFLAVASVKLPRGSKWNRGDSA